MIFLFCLKTMEMQRGYNVVPEKVFSGIKSDFFQVLLDLRGYISNRNDSFSSRKEIFVTYL